jgi:molecular chaperone HtpG
MTTGRINVQTENIFPIIKKFLYSDHEIFLRELISNAVDATTKLKALASMGHFKGELNDLTIEVVLDKDAKTLTIKDKGIGMTAEEVEKYINQIAFSSAEDFVSKFKGKGAAESANIIGHFGLGFYSSFMVASKVEIISKTYKKGAGTKAVHWECDGSPDYSLTDQERTERGTDIILHIADDSLEFLEENRILDLLTKYCKFLPVPIRFGEESKYEKVEGEKDEQGNDKWEQVKRPRIINNTMPAWKTAPSELNDEDYLKFYRELYPATFEEPIFNIHLNVDYPFNLTGILYFPRVKNNFEVQKNKIQLYSNQVFVTDSVEGIVPDFLMLMHGVLDSPDIPLNVSRSYLQSDSNVKKISNHIMKKVSDKLEDIFTNRRSEFESKWDDVRIFIQYGMISEDKFYERAEKFCLLKNSEGQYFTFEEYREKIAATQSDKEGKIVHLYTNDPQSQHAYLNTAREKGYDVLVLDGALDAHFINMLEYKLEKVHFARIDSDTIEKLIVKEEEQISKLSDEEKDQVKVLFEGQIDSSRFHVQFESLSEKDSPVLITRPEFMRRMKEMQALGGANYVGDLPDSYNLIVNSNHSIIGKILNEADEESRMRKVKQLCDLALLSQNLLSGEALTAFIKRSVNIIE